MELYDVYVVRGSIRQDDIWDKSLNDFPDVENHIPLTSSLEADNVQLRQSVPVMYSSQTEYT